MSFVNVKNNIYSEFENISKSKNIPVSELIHQATTFYLTYLKYLQDEKELLRMLENLKNDNKDDVEKLAELQTVRNNLSNFFFKDVNQKLIEIESYIVEK